MRFGKHPPEESVELMMTPMIDVVFQLLIFFMVVATISDIVGNVKVILPVADYAAEDLNPSPERLIINIEKDGTYVVGGQRRDKRELWKAISLEAKLSRDPENPTVANRSILLRVDKHSRFRNVEEVLEMCEKQRLWKLSFAAKIEEDTM